MSSLRSHLPFALLMLVAAPLTLHFVWHAGLASVGDDSVGYLILAQHLAGNAGPWVREWVPFHAYFPPLFPLTLAAFGASADFLAAHRVVGFFALLALAMLYRYAAFQLASVRAALLVVVMFLLTPTAWTSITGILSEALFLFLTLAALHFHATRLSDPAGVRVRDALFFGVLLGLAFLTRTAATALVVAYVLQASIRALSQRSGPRGRLALPLLPLAAMAALWIALRPAYQGVNYGLVLGPIVDTLRDDPLRLAVLGGSGLASGWVASFASEADVHIVTRCVFLAVGALGICGAVIRARRNALDGWYALASLAMLYAWFLGEDTMRRLLYPVVPVLLVHAALFVRYLAGRMKPGPAARLLPLVFLLPPALLALPAVVLIHSKSLERSPAIAGFPYSFAGVTDFYTTIAVQRARSIAARHIAVLAGLQALQSDTPPGAKVMWVRPDYVALLGNRQGVPWHSHGGLRGLAEEVRRSGAEYLIVSTLYKADIHGEKLDPIEALEAPPPFLRPAALTRNPVLGTNEFALMRVDREALDAYLAAR
jgi:type IV secretory pathway VirB3-like protein